MTTPRRITPGLAGAPTDVDVVVVGLGVTGAGVALDAVSRGLTVLAVDAHDLAFGTSRFSSKLVHGGLRYLASGQVGIAHESAVERGILMETTAPHLTRPLPSLIPLSASVSRPGTSWSSTGPGTTTRVPSAGGTRTFSPCPPSAKPPARSSPPHQLPCRHDVETPLRQFTHVLSHT